MLIDKLVIAALSPLGTALCLSLLAALLAGNRRPSWAQIVAKSLFTLALAWLTFWSLPAVSGRARAWLEADYPAVSVNSLPTAQAIVVLGGTMSPPARDGLPANLGEAVDRLWLAAELYHAGKAPMILLSGGSDPQRSRTSEASAMQDVLSALGVPAHAMQREESSRNTRENARESATLLLPQGRSHVLLVTSALHMRRAIAQFEAQGLVATPAATDHTHTGSQEILGWVPDTGALAGSAQAIKEWVGQRTGR